MLESSQAIVGITGISQVRPEFQGPIISDNGSAVISRNHPTLTFRVPSAALK